MNEETSIYLDAVRFTAATVVFFCHMSEPHFSGGFLWWMNPYGTEAVWVFFVLSGFVIAYVYDARENNPLEYAVSRFARIYSVAIPALIATFILDAIGHSINPGAYDSGHWVLPWHGRLSQYLHAAFFVNEVWFNHISPGSDAPYWSLGYEVWYYVLFGLAVFAPRQWRAPSIVLVLLFVGPKITVLLPIWLLGVAAYHICKRVELPVMIGGSLAVGAVLGWAGFEVYAWDIGRPHWPQRPDIDILEAYIIGTLFFLHLVGFRSVSHIPGSILKRLKRPIRWISGATLTMYLFHFPLAQFLQAMLPWPAASWKSRTILYLGVPFLVFVIAEFTERRKDIWRHGFRSLFRHVIAFAADPNT